MTSPSRKEKNKRRLGHKKRPVTKVTPKPKHKEIRLDELQAILERTKAALSPEDHATLTAAVETFAFLTHELETKGASIARLRRLIFGPSTDKTDQVIGDDTESGDGEATAGEPRADADAEPDTDKDPAKRKGHGRRAAATYRGAKRVKVEHESLKAGDPCPACPKGKVYPLEPAVLIRVTAMAPLQATVYERQRLRCNACGKVFTARLPDGVGEQKYDETAASMISMLKYGCGFPFNRIERLEEGLGIPLPATTQWELVSEAAEHMDPAYIELVRQAAQGEVLYNDDTTMKVLELQGAPESDTESGDSDDRTGTFTSGIVATADGHQIALFFTGQKHAGENLAELLEQRAAELAPPIQMCDSLSWNTAGDFETIVANCNAHARRRFVEVFDNFRDECSHILKTFRQVYRNDALAKERNLSPKERLEFHQAESGPLMEALAKWFKEQFEQRKIEPNSTLGDAIVFMQKHWDKLTLFLRQPGAPLDNNVCERALKKAILHRKASLFYKTLNGAHVGDMMMSLIHTAELNGVGAYEYLVALQRHRDHVALNPGDWMPWNYQQTLAMLTTKPSAADRPCE